MNEAPQRPTGRAHLFHLVHTTTGAVEQVRGLTEAEARQFNTDLGAANSPLRWVRLINPTDHPAALGG